MARGRCIKLTSTNPRTVNILLLAPLVIYKETSKMLLVLGRLSAETGDKTHQCLSSATGRGLRGKEIFLHPGHAKGKFHIDFQADP